MAQPASASITVGKVMPFGLFNAPATFQRLMDLALAGLQWSQCLVYLDDVIVIGKTFDEHLQNLGAVFKCIQEAGLKLKPTKCTFFQEQVHYLGHVISRGVTPDDEKSKKLFLGQFHNLPLKFSSF